MSSYWMLAAWPNCRSPAETRLGRGTPWAHGPMTMAVRSAFPPRAATSPAKFPVAPCGPYASSCQPEKLSTAAFVRPYLPRNSAKSQNGSSGSRFCQVACQGAMAAKFVSPFNRATRSPRMLALIQLAQELSHTPFEYQNWLGDWKVIAGTIALSDGGLSIAASHCTAPG